MKEWHARSIIKAVSWRCCATLLTILIVYTFTRRWVLSFEVGAVEVITKLLFYYAHERIWLRVKWGRPKDLF